MTWAIIRRFMSGRGGYGLMFRDLGFDPDPQLDENGFIDLVCGRTLRQPEPRTETVLSRFSVRLRFCRLKQHPSAFVLPDNPASARSWRRGGCG